MCVSLHSMLVCMQKDGAFCDEDGDFQSRVNIITKVYEDELELLRMWCEETV